MLAFNLSIAATVFLALYALTALIQALRKDLRAGCWSHFLITVAILLFSGSFIFSTRTEEPQPLTTPISAGALISLAVLSVITLFIERRGEQFAALYSRAILGLGTSVILTVSLFLTPLVPESIIQIPTSTPVSQSLLAASNSAGVAAGNIVPTQDTATTATPVATAEPTLTRTPLPSPSPTRTRRAYVPPTATETPELEAVAEACDAQTTVNINVRSEPSTDAEIVAIVPEGLFIEIFGKNDDGTWWNTEFEGERGWVFGGLLQFDPVCNAG
ncbi:MAG: SH3 domain-containing protein [Chloroflexota bacterium]